MYFVMKQELEGGISWSIQAWNAVEEGIKQEEKAEEFCSIPLYEREMPLFLFRMPTSILCFLEIK